MIISRPRRPLASARLWGFLARWVKTLGGVPFWSITREGFDLLKHALVASFFEAARSLIALKGQTGEGLKTCENL